MTVDTWLALAGAAATVLGGVAVGVWRVAALLRARERETFEQFDEIAAHARKGREALALSLRDELRRAMDDVRREADRVYAQSTAVARLEARLDAIETKLGEIHAAVVPHSSTR